MANSGSVSYLFEKRVVVFDVDCDSDRVMEVAIDAGADDVDLQDDGSVEVTTMPDSFESVVSAFNDQSMPYLDASIEMVPHPRVLLDVEKAKGFIKLTDKLKTMTIFRMFFTMQKFPMRRWRGR